MTQFQRPLADRSSIESQRLAFLVRFALCLLAIPAVGMGHESIAVPNSIWAWLCFVVAFDLVVGATVRWLPRLSRRLGQVAFAFDFLAFGALPYLVDDPTSIAPYFALYPALVTAIRYGPGWGFITSLLMIAPIAGRALVALTAAPSAQTLAGSYPCLVAAVWVAGVGHLVRIEVEHAMGGYEPEMADLRQSLTGARLLLKTASSLSTTTSYAPILESMLDAGVSGLRTGLVDQGQAVGIVLFFSDDGPNRDLRVVSSRHLDRRDIGQRIPGRTGVVSQALDSGNRIAFGDVRSDPELSAFSALSRCRSGICFPLQAGLEQYGVVIIASPSTREPSAQHAELMLAFCSQAATAFQNAKLYRDLRTEHDQTIRSDNEMRQKLARDLHDGPTQKVAALVMQLDIIKKLLDRDMAEAKREIDKARRVAQQTVKEIRNALFTLRPLVLETQGLSVAIEQYCARLRDAENVPVKAEAGHVGTELDPNIGATVFAIVDEAVGNARKHAGGKPISVRISMQQGTLVAMVRDQGPGFNVDQVLNGYEERSSLGMQNMRERARLIDAELRIDSGPGRGTCITLIVPLPQIAVTEAGS